MDELPGEAAPPTWQERKKWTQENTPSHTTGRDVLSGIVATAATVGWLFLTNRQRQLTEYLAPTIIGAVAGFVVSRAHYWWNLHVVSKHTVPAQRLAASNTILRGERDLAQRERDEARDGLNRVLGERPKIQVAFKKIQKDSVILVRNLGAPANFHATIILVESSVGGGDTGRSLPLHWQTAGTAQVRLQTNGEDYVKFGRCEIDGGGAIVTFELYRHAPLDPPLLHEVFWSRSWATQEGSGSIPVKALCLVCITSEPQMVEGPKVYFFQVGPWGILAENDDGFEFHGKLQTLRAEPA